MDESESNPETTVLLTATLRQVEQHEEGVRR